MTIRVNPPIDHELARQIAIQAFGADTPLEALVPLPGGQVNSTAMLILNDGRRAVLRIAPDPAVAAQGPSWLSSHGLRREAAVIARAANLQSLLPVTLAWDFTQNLIPRDWVMQEVMPGVPLATLAPSLDDEALATIWREIGAFTRTLHDHRGEGFGALTEGPVLSTWTSLLRHDTEGLLRDASRFGLPLAPFEHLCQFVSTNAAVLNTAPPALIHSDLNPAHVFITDDDEDGSLHLAGVIDLEYSRFADPLSEHLLWSSLSGAMPEPPRSSFLDGYGGWLQAPGDPVRGQVASAVGLAWEATLVASQGGDWAPPVETLTQMMDQRS